MIIISNKSLKWIIGKSTNPERVYFCTKINSEKIWMQNVPISEIMLEKAFSSQWLILSVDEDEL